jgi:hydrogenase maturation factor
MSQLFLEGKYHVVMASVLFYPLGITARLLCDVCEERVMVGQYVLVPTTFVLNCYDENIVKR